MVLIDQLCASKYTSSFSKWNETPWTEVQGFLVAPRLRRITYASLRAPFIPEFKSSGFSGRFDKRWRNKGLARWVVRYELRLKEPGIMLRNRL
jgi:hypothetical protein